MYQWAILSQLCEKSEEFVLVNWSIVIQGKFILTSPSYRQLKCINLLVLICLLLVDCFVWFKLFFAAKPHSTFFTPLYFVYLCVPFQCFPWVECLLAHHTYRFYVFLHVFCKKVLISLPFETFVTNKTAGIVPHMLSFHVITQIIFVHGVVLTRWALMQRKTFSTCLSL